MFGLSLDDIRIARNRGCETRLFTVPAGARQCALIVELRTPTICPLKNITEQEDENPELRGP
jgi:hypothetical protein